MSVFLHPNIRLCGANDNQINSQIVKSEISTLYYFGDGIASLKSAEAGTSSGGDRSLLSSLRDQLDLCLSCDDIIKELSSLLGPWALLYLRRDLKKLFIGRDVFGRKSLLWSRQSEDVLNFSQLITDFKLKWHEVPPGSITVLDTAESIFEHASVYRFYECCQSPWSEQFPDCSTIVLHDARRRLLTIRRADPPITEVTSAQLSDAAGEFLVEFGEAVKRSLMGVDGVSKSVGILFSGGVDSLLLALVTAQHLPPSSTCDLVNVAFGGASKKFGGAPDRKRAIRAFRYLKSRKPAGPFQLVLVNVRAEELAKCREAAIANAIRPSCSVLDDSIGCVLWFAGRAQGHLFRDDSSTENEADGGDYRSRAEVMLVGSGADELFGGYMRYRHCFETDGWSGAIRELESTLAVIGEKNLSRDDRIFETLHKVPRAPYLDDIFVQWANRVPIELKADFTKERGVGEKQLLREALKVLGVPEEFYRAPKQAMQFGSRIAHLEGRNENGSDVCSRLLRVQ